MELLKDAGRHNIVHITPDALKLIEYAARTAYNSRDKTGPGSAEKLIRHLLSKNPPHTSVLEHAHMTVEFIDVSRGFTHELVRHRHTAITQRSTRYVDESNLRVVIPPNMNPVLAERIIKDTENHYRCYRDAGYPAQDVRQFLPIGVVSTIVFTTNFSEWRHIFNIRTTNNCHWEMKRVMRNLLDDVKEQIPVVFEDITY